MKVSELRAGQGKVDTEVTVKSKEAPRAFQKYGRELKVCNAVVQDDSGEIKMSLWNSDADKINVGDKIKITNGYVSEFNGEKQLTSGKYGKLEVVSPNSDKADSGQKTMQNAVKPSSAEKPVSAKKNDKKSSGKADKNDLGWKSEDEEIDVELNEKDNEDDYEELEDKEF